MINNDLQTLDRNLKIEQVKPPKIQVLSFCSKGGTRLVTNIRQGYHVICTIAFIVFRNTYSTNIDIYVLLDMTLKQYLGKNHISNNIYVILTIQSPLALYISGVFGF
jgi:hypothetical protein